MRAVNAIVRAGKSPCAELLSGVVSPVAAAGDVAARAYDTTAGLPACPR